MNRREAEIFEAIFIRREIFERIDTRLDALDILQCMRCLQKRKNSIG